MRPLAVALALFAGVPLPAPPADPATRLVGVWELKADDGRSGTRTLRPDRSLTAASTAGGSSLPDYHGRWAVVTVDGDRFTVEFDKPGENLSSYTVTLVFTCPDAFTLIETKKGGSTIRDSQRFARVGRP
jgi:hypothetical protein